MDETSRNALRGLLGSCYSTTALRRMLDQFSPAVAVELSPGLPHAELVHQAVLALERHGLIGEALFERLREDRPARTAEIAIVASLWGVDKAPDHVAPTLLGTIPPAPPVFVGRQQAVQEVIDMLPRGVCGIHALPGMGKTALATVVARHPGVQEAFPGGVGWLSIGPDHTESDLLGVLNRWGEPLNATALRRATTVRDAAAALRPITESRAMLLIADDVWRDGQVQHLPHAIGAGSALLLTSRNQNLIAKFAPVKQARQALQELDEGSALELMAAIVPDAVTHHRDVVAELCAALNYTPLALVVAARLLAVNGPAYGGVDALARHLATSHAILHAEAPADVPWRKETTPTVANILQSSTDALSDDSRRRFAQLGKFRAKPATFRLRVLAALWGVEDARPHIAELVQRGLVEAAGNGRFQIHALLRSLANTLLAEVSS